MQVPVVVWVALGGALGAMARWAVSPWVHVQDFPWATLVVNVTGSALIGVLIGWFADAAWFHAVGRPLLVVGLLGAFTTFSSFSMDTLALAEARGAVIATGYVLANVVGSIGMAWLGFRLGGGV